MVNFSEELDLIFDVLRGWAWQVPLSIVMIIFLVVSGHKLPLEMIGVLLIGLVGSYVSKKMMQPRFQDIPEIVDQFKYGSDAHALSASKRLIAYVTDEKKGYEHKFIVVRNHIGEALSKRLQSNNPELLCLCATLAGHCANHPKNVFALGHDGIVLRLLMLLSHESTSVVCSACFALSIFLKNKECCEELAADTGMYKVLESLLGHFEFDVCQHACVLLTLLSAMLKPADRKKLTEGKLLSKLVALTRVPDNEPLVACACRALSVLLDESGIPPNDNDDNDNDDNNNNDDDNNDTTTTTRRRQTKRTKAATKPGSPSPSSTPEGASGEPNAVSVDEARCALIDSAVQCGAIEAVCEALSTAQGSIMKLKFASLALATLCSKSCNLDRARRTGVLSSLKVLNKHRNPAVATASTKAQQLIADD